jgi:hypothetical protein
MRRPVVVSPMLDPGRLGSRIDQAIAAGAPSVLKMHPGPHGDGFPLATWVLDPLTALCERHGYALAVDYGSSEPAPLVELDAFARLAPEVPVLLLGHHLAPALGFGRLLDRCPNVLLEVTPAAAPEQVGEAVSRYGAHRFVFGSRGKDVTDPLLFLLGDADRETVLRTSAKQLDHRTWRNEFL